MKFKHVVIVRQKLPADCAIACIAMATGLPYWKVFQAAPMGEDELAYGLTLQQVVTTMRRLGKRTKWHWPEKFSPNKTGVFLRDKVRGKNAIHLVPSISKREAGCFHYVLVSNGIVYDPAPRKKRRYRKYNELKPLGIVYQPQDEARI